MATFQLFVSSIFQSGTYFEIQKVYIMNATAIDFLKRIYKLDWNCMLMNHVHSKDSRQKHSERNYSKVDYAETKANPSKNYNKYSRNDQSVKDILSSPGVISIVIIGVIVGIIIGIIVSST